MVLLVGDTIYFSAIDGSTGSELWAHDTSNQSTWRVADINNGAVGSNPGQYMQLLVGDTIYFSANDGSTGSELWAHDTSNQSTWRVADINSGTGNSAPGQYMQLLVGDTIYFNAECGNTCGNELWAHDTSNHSTWQVADIYAGSTDSYPGTGMSVVDGDILYFDARDANGFSIYA
ncbi:MAG: hyalin, partial [Candidatus Thermoplasmatota archaeon]|nr:hyalin [Candidatus Thermoplasmatota archaeon]